MAGRDFEKIKKYCTDIGARCHKCKYVIKHGMTKGLCGVRDSNGLTPNQSLYGDKFFLINKTGGILL